MITGASCEMDQKLKNRLGFLAYILKTLQSICKAKSGGAGFTGGNLKTVKPEWSLIALFTEKRPLIKSGQIQRRNIPLYSAPMQKRNAYRC